MSTPRFASALRLASMLICLSATALFAHDPGLSSTTLWLDAHELRATLSFSPADLEALAPMDLDGDREVSDAEFEETRPVLEDFVRQGVQLRLDDVDRAADELTIERTEDRRGRNVEIKLRFPVPAQASHLAMQNRLLEQLPYGHRHYVQLLDGGANPLASTLLDAQHNVFETDLAPAADTSKSHTFGDFYLLGIEHILTGYDHLLFLFGLLVVGAGFASAAKIITSFTVAHSITLALATFEIVQLSPRVVEPLIAVSIAYVGVENIFRKNLDRRWMLTFAFGLIHGLGFAAVLRELGVANSPGGAWQPLLAFNLGVETGQIAIALAALPLIWRVSASRPQFAQILRPAVSSMVTLLGFYWLFERVWMA